MPRANRYLTAGAAYHLTHRCHDRAFLLKFARDRDGYREILRVESARRGLSVLSYAITSNHVHLLVADTDAASVAAFMQATQGRFAEEYNRRKGRQGAFWSDRYHATMIEGGDHLWACLKYIDLNMVRAGVVGHPREWEWTAWRELMGERQRYRLIDPAALLDRLEGVTPAAFRRSYRALIEEALKQRAGLRRDGRWTEAMAVGGERFVDGLAARLEAGDLRRNWTRQATNDGGWVLRESGPRLGLYAISRAENGR
jgi:putative transposase